MNLRCPNEECKRFLVKDFWGTQAEFKCRCGWIVRVTIPIALDKALATRVVSVSN